MQKLADEHARPSGDTGQSYVRTYSKVCREVRNGNAVYVKEYFEGDWGWTKDVVRLRTIREAELIGRLSELPDLNGRLGTLRLVTADIDRALVVTEEAPGKPLDTQLIVRRQSAPARTLLCACYCAGKWLRVFQTLPLLPGDETRIGEVNPNDLLEYCRIRLQTIRSLGYKWISVGRERHIIAKLDRLIENAPQSDLSRVWSHGDYSAGNVLWDGRTLTAIDFAMAALEPSLLDVKYFIHRLEMLRIYFPWRRWPIDTWKQAFLRGYGRTDAEQSPMYQALTIRHLLCRLQSHVRRPGTNLKQRLHSTWIRRCVRSALVRILSRV